MFEFTAPYDMKGTLKNGKLPLEWSGFDPWIENW